MSADRITLPRRSLRSSANDRDRARQLVADAAERWPHLGVYLVTESWMSDPTATHFSAIGREGVGVVELSDDDALRPILADSVGIVRRWASAEATALGVGLLDNDLARVDRPPRLKRVRGKYVRQCAADFDWLECLSYADRRRIGRRFTDDGLHSPDVVSMQVRNVTGQDWTDSACMDWLIREWTREDALRSVAAGRFPNYAANVEDLLAPDLALQGFTIAGLYGPDPLDHVADVMAQHAENGARCDTIGSTAPATYVPQF